MNTTQAAVKADIEQIIDKYGISETLMLIAEVCNDKQQHVAENWQDKALAAKWQKVSNKIEQARTQIDLINW